MKKFGTKKPTVPKFPSLGGLKKAVEKAWGAKVPKAGKLTRPIGGRTTAGNRPFTIEAVRCPEPGCRKFYRSREDLAQHLRTARHCPKCGWGTDDPTGAAKLFRICEVCMWEDAPVRPSKPKKSAGGRPAN